MINRPALQALQQSAQHATQRAAALGLAALLTVAMLVSVNQLASTPSPDSLLAAGNAQMALAKAQPQT